MRTAGIVRRIDELGRVVIPKEIRQRFRIRVGDPIEFFITKEGVLIKKFSDVGILEDIAQAYAESLYENTGCCVLITDMEHVIASGGPLDIVGKRIGKDLMKLLYEEENAAIIEAEQFEFLEEIEMVSSSSIFAPIRQSHGTIGSIVMMRDGGNKLTEFELDAAKLAAKLFEKHL